jgi:FtsH-binding integral membrane protein
VLGVSVVFLLLGSVRKLAGFFVPGGISLVVTVIPLLWTRMTALESAGVVIGLLVLAGLIGFVAVRLEQVKGSAKNASKWLRELK